jgi:hypothetical protein
MIGCKIYWTKAHECDPRLGQGTIVSISEKDAPVIYVYSEAATKTEVEPIYAKCCYPLNKGRMTFSEFSYDAILGMQRVLHKHKLVEHLNASKGTEARNSESEARTPSQVRNARNRARFFCE